MADQSTITEHRITYAEAMSLAWMLELVAARSREMGCVDAATGFEACAATFRQSVSYALDSVVEMTESTILNLVATVTTVVDRLADDDDDQSGRTIAWSLVADELFYRDEHGTRLSGFFAECPTPQTLPRYVQATVEGFKAKL